MMVHYILRNLVISTMLHSIYFLLINHRVYSTIYIHFQMINHREKETTEFFFYRRTFVICAIR